MYYLDVTERVEVDTVEEALALREEWSNQPEFSLEHFEYTEKYDKKNDREYVVVKAKKVINKEKEPASNVVLTYGF